jgi:hypothetical protein
MIEWLLNWAHDMELESFSQGLQIFFWKLFNQSSYMKVMSLQSGKSHNMLKSKKLGILVRKELWDFFILIQTHQWS